MAQIFQSEPSRWIMGMYWVILIFLISLTVLFYPISYEDLLAYYILVVTLSLISFLFIFMIYRAYNMTFTVSKNLLTIKGVFSTWTIDKSEIKAMQSKGCDDQLQGRGADNNQEGKVPPDYSGEP
jgi:hypothetical protein